MRRRRTGRVVAGVASGLAEHLGAPVFWVRAVFAGFAALSGIGIIAYALLWMFVPQSTVAEPETEKDRKEWQQAVVSGTPAAAANAQLQQAMSFAQFAVGDVVEAVCEVEVDAGAANLYPLHLSIQSGGVVESVRAGYGGTSPEYGFTTAEAWNGILRTPPLTIKAGMTSRLILIPSTIS